MRGGTEDVGAIITVLMCLNIGAFLFGNIGPHIQAMSLGASAAQDIFAIIERQSVTGGDTLVGPFEVEGNIEFRNVSHVYPSRPEARILQDFSMVFPAGKVTAIVGASGSGKSTIISILERFYEPISGQVLLDGHEINHLDVQWLRQQFGLVGQEPVLFNGTIFTNVTYGLKGTKYEQESKEAQIKLVTEACRIANAHDFIMGLPNGYDQEVGIRGASLSGGQRQRIAIARAIVSDPKILLLDEATSALDVQSEEAVQVGLNTASSGRTTIVIAHSLSTVKLADNIVVMDGGKVAEQGTHAELLAMEGLYHSFVRRQQLKQAISEPPSSRITPALENPAMQQGPTEKTESNVVQVASQAAEENDRRKYSYSQLVHFVSRLYPSR
jgi:ATP-binding cassette subfamily B (MDR/TAP) protein 1